MAKKKEASDPSNIKLQPLGRSSGRRARRIGKGHRRRHRPARHGQGQAHPRQGRQRRRRPALDNGTRSPLQVKAGNRVLFSSYAGDTFKLGTRELLLLREEDILAVIE